MDLIDVGFNKMLVLSHVPPFVTLWIVACQDPSVRGILQALNWVAILFARGSS